MKLILEPYFYVKVSLAFVIKLLPDFMAWIFFDVISIAILKIKIIVKNIALRANKKLEKCVP